MVYKRDHLYIDRVKQVHTVVYEGKAVSNNEYYASNNWRTRHGIKAKFSKIFNVLLSQAGLPWMDKYAVMLFYNGRQDPDNLGGGFVKLFLDALKQERKKGQIIKQGWVYDDSPEYCKMVSTCYDYTLKPNTFEFVILEL